MCKAFHRIFLFYFNLFTKVTINIHKKKKNQKNFKLFFEYLYNDMKNNKKPSVFSQLFSDKNEINEKSIVGFISFGIMIILAFLDLATGYFTKDLIISEYIYNSFLILTLGSLGIGSVDKYINKHSDYSDNYNESSNTSYGTTNTYGSGDRDPDVI